MRFPKAFAAMAITGLLVAACGGAAPTQSPGGGTPTQAPGPTQGGGGPVLPGNGSGKVTYEISGDKQKVGELPFFGVSSRFGGPAGKYFTFTPADGSSSEIVTIYPDVTNEGSWLVGYVSEEFQVSATACVITNLQSTDTHASGSFDCENAIIVSTGATTLGSGRIKGTFEANA